MTEINLLGLTVYPYGLAVAAAAALSLGLMALLAKRSGVKQAAVSWAAVLAVPLGVLGARLGYFLTVLDQVGEEGFGFFAQLVQGGAGGFLLFGAALGCLLALALAARITRTPFASLADLAAAPAMLMVALTRLADGLVEEGGIGRSVADWFAEDSGMSSFALEDPSFFCRFPFAVPDSYDDWMWAVFVLEAVVAAAILAAVLLLKPRRAGGKALLTVTLYACTQVLCESLLTNVPKFGFVRINQILCAVVIAAALVGCIMLDKDRSVRRIVMSAAGVVVGMLLVIAMEFALEDKISAIEAMNMDQNWLVMLLACALMGASVLAVWRRAFPALNGKKENA